MIKHIKNFAPWVKLDELVNELPLEQETIKLYGRAIQVPRLTSWHGVGSYTFSGLTRDALPWTKTLLDLKYLLVVSEQVEFNSCLANYYRDGSDSVAWHSDDEPELGPTSDDIVIASLSFGDTRRFLTRCKETKQKQEYTLEHGDLIVMAGNFQQTHEHCVPKTKKHKNPRLNLTYRVRI